MKRFGAWILGVINHRVDCPKCGGFRTGILIGEWGLEMRECRACNHYWEVPYDLPAELEGMGLWRYFARRKEDSDAGNERK